METWQLRRFAEAGIDAQFVQENFSHSTHGTLRGLHYQIEQPQGKLVRVVQGEVFDVAVDLRRSSPHFGQWVGEILSAENKHQLRGAARIRARIPGLKRHGRLRIQLHGLLCAGVRAVNPLG